MLFIMHLSLYGKETIVYHATQNQLDNSIIGAMQSRNEIQMEDIYDNNENLPTDSREGPGEHK